MIFPGNAIMISFLKVKKKKLIKSNSSLLWVSRFITWASHVLSISLNVLCFVFDFWAIIFNGTRNMKHGRKFQFVGIIYSNLFYI